MIRHGRRFVIAGAAVAVGCGGVAAIDNAGAFDGGGRDATTADGGGASLDGANALDSSDGGIVATEAGPCPTPPPVVGAPCDTVGHVCEYGDAFHIECDYVLRCDPGNHWSVEYDGGAGCPFTTQGCPSSIADIDASMCGMIPLSCDFSGVNCTCGLACASHSPFTFWTCFGGDGGACPWPRPRVGTACAQEGLFCPYAPPCCEGLILDCTGGFWQGQSSGPCP